MELGAKTGIWYAETSNYTPDYKDANVFQVTSSEPKYSGIILLTLFILPSNDF
jgi:hypothetical protein